MPTGLKTGAGEELDAFLLFDLSPLLEVLVNLNPGKRKRKPKVPHNP